MIGELAQLFALSLLISLATFGGGAQALYYQYGVQQTGWITSTDLSAALAFGYATPGPAVFGISTFIGYQLGGVPGALVGTAGIFVVPFVTALLAAKYFSGLLQNQHAAMFITAVGLAATGVVAGTAFSVLDYDHAKLWQFAVVFGALFASIKWKLNPLFILLVGGAIGLIL